MKTKLFPSILLLIFIFFQACTSAPDDPVMPGQMALGEYTEQPIIESSEESELPEQMITEETPMMAEDIIKDINPVRSLVDEFYQWYFEQSGDEIFSQRVYEQHPALSDIFKSDIGYLLDSFEEQSGYDPFLCAQDILPNLSFEQIFISGGDAYALGQVVIEDEVRHFLVVQLGKGDGDWKIDAIHCPFAPQTTAIAFYTAYLGYITGGEDSALGIGEPRNPYVDGFLSNMFMLSEDFRAKMMALYDQETGRDPILQAQTFPMNFWVEPGQEGDVITARLIFGPQSARYYDLHLIQGSLFYWQINDITTQEIPVFDPMAHQEVDTQDWNLYENDAFLFNFRYPQDWTAKEANLSDIPSDDPLKETTFFYPGWAEPNLPALWVSVLVGDESAIMNYYVTENHQRVEINGIKVGVDRDQFETRYVFQHPDLENTWIVIGDTSPGAEGREQYAQELEMTIAPLLRSVIFGSN